MVESCPREYADKAGLVEAKKKMEEVVSALEGGRLSMCVSYNTLNVCVVALQISCLSRTRSSDY